MKLEAKITHTITHKQKLSQKQQYALSVLSMNEQQLKEEIDQALEENPLLEVDDTLYQTSSSQDIYEHASAIVSKEKDLRQILEEQLQFCNQPILHDLAFFLIDSLDTNGYLTISTQELMSLFSYNEDEIEDTIAVLQTFEPSGIFARNLQESLLIQLCNGDIPYSPIAIQIVNEYLEDVACNRWSKISTELNISMDELRDAITLIRSLSPKPASPFHSSAQPIRPVARIHVADQSIHIEFLQKTSFLKINQEYANLKDEVASAYIKVPTSNAQTLLSALQKRESTLDAILKSICKYQQDYFLYHKELIPLTLKDISKEIDLHESTISRAISNKVIEFEQRYIPMKAFFPARLESGQSATGTIQRIKEIIRSEHPKKPYSDANIAKLLEREGVQISRRTVAKYRELAKLGTAQQRKQI